LGGLLGLPASFNFGGEAGLFLLLGLPPNFGLSRGTRGLLGLPASFGFGGETGPFLLLGLSPSLRRDARGLLGLPASFGFGGETGPFLLLGLSPSLRLRRNTRGLQSSPATSQRSEPGPESRRDDPKERCHASLSCGSYMEDRGSPGAQAAAPYASLSPDQARRSTHLSSRCHLVVRLRRQPPPWAHGGCATRPAKRTSWPADLLSVNNQVHVVSPPQVGIDRVLDSVMQREAPVDRRHRNHAGSPQNTKRVPVNRERVPAQAVQENAPSTLPRQPRKASQHSLRLDIRDLMKSIERQVPEVAPHRRK
jgi:hypothetical protein